VVDHLPLARDAQQYRFAVVSLLCATAVLGLVLDHLHATLACGAARLGARRILRAAGPAAVTVVAAGLALAPSVVALRTQVPAPVQPLVVPRWFTTAARTLPPGRVLATYPFTTADSQAALPWQALAGLPAALAGGGGPTGTVSRAGRDAPGFAVLRAASFPLLRSPPVTPRTLGAVRRALEDWGVTTVVVPADPGLPSYETARSAAYGVAFYTAVLGSSPVHQDGSWVWDDVRHAPPPLGITWPEFVGCVLHPGVTGPGAPWSTCLEGLASHP
jgi:hypothetical protein